MDLIIGIWPGRENHDSGKNSLERSQLVKGARPALLGGQKSLLVQIRPQAQ